MANNDKTPVWPGWETVRLIGRGSYGAVYEIERDNYGHKEKAALKDVTIPQSASDIDDLLNDGYDEKSISTRFEGYMQDIVREYSMMADMKGCANIVYCDDWKSIRHDDGMGWDILIKMELLTSLVKALGKEVSDGQVIRIGTDICSALAFCETRNVLHRDIKPQNIFVAPDGTCKLGDFGIAKTAERTTSGTKTGTYKYMAPEVYNNQPYGGKADIYSLGLVLYWLLNERRTPFLPLPPEVPSASQEDEARGRRFRGETLPAPAHGSEELQRIVLKACAYDPKERYQSAEEMLRDLKALSGSAAEQAPETPAEPTEPQPSPIKPEPTAGGTIGVFGGEQTKDPAIMPAADVGNADENKRDDPAVQEDTAAGPYATNNERTVGSATVGVFDRKETAESGNQADKAQHKKKKRVLPVILGVAATLAVAGAAVFFFWPRYGEWSDWSVAEPEETAGRKIETATEYRTREKVLLSTEKKDEVVGEVDHEEIDYGAWGEWSKWQTSEIGAAEGLDVEEGTQYRFREKEYTTSQKASLSGWTQYDSKTEQVWGNWSGWSNEEANASDTRKVETGTQYRYRDKEYTTSAQSVMNGWTQYDSKADSSWGNWGSWSVNSITASDSRQVETGTQYRYRDKEYTTSPSSSLAGWTQYDVSTTSGWGPWSGWQYASTQGQLPAESETRQVEVKTNYYLYKELIRPADNGGAYRTQLEMMEGPVDSPDKLSYGSFVVLETNPAGYDSYPGNTEGSYIETMVSWDYNYRTRDWGTTSTYYYYRWNSWSSWSNNAVSQTADREVQTRTVYRYRDLNTSYSYYYWRWGDWSSWSNSAVSQTNNREVQTQAIYRYKDANDQTTYYYWRWGDWSEWSFTEAKASDETEVANRTVYRSREGEKVPIYYYYDWSDWSDWSTDKETEADDREVESRTVFRYRDRQ